MPLYDDTYYILHPTGVAATDDANLADAKTKVNSSKYAGLKLGPGTFKTSSGWVWDIAKNLLAPGFGLTTIQAEAALGASPLEVDIPLDGEGNGTRGLRVGGFTVDAGPMTTKQHALLVSQFSKGGIMHGIRIIDGLTGLYVVKNGTDATYRDFQIYNQREDGARFGFGREATTEIIHGGENVIENFWIQNVNQSAGDFYGLRFQSTHTSVATDPGGWHLINCRITNSGGTQMGGLLAQSSITDAAKWGQLYLHADQVIVDNILTSRPAYWFQNVQGVKMSNCWAVLSSPNGDVGLKFERVKGAVVDNVHINTPGGAMIGLYTNCTGIMFDEIATDNSTPIFYYDGSTDTSLISIGHIRAPPGYTFSNDDAALMERVHLRKTAGFHVLTKSGAGINQTLTIQDAATGLTMSFRVDAAGNLELVNNGFTSKSHRFNTDGDLLMKKISAAVVAAGAGFGLLRWETGTNAGTLKLVAYSGTSTTGVTIVDNVGGGN